MADSFLVERMLPHIGRTVTIFTESGGLSGSGFTGVLAAVCDRTVKLITDIGAAPACPVGSACVGGVCGYGNGDYGQGGYGYGGYGQGGYGYGGNCGYSGYGYGNNCGYGGYGKGGNCGCNGYGNGGNYGYGSGFGFGGFGGSGYNWLGSIAEIPIDKIVSFTHNAI